MATIDNFKNIFQFDLGGVPIKHSVILKVIVFIHLFIYFI